MSIVSHPANANYRDNFDEVFGKREKPNACRVYNTTCPTPELCRLDDPNAPCLAGETDAPTETFTLAQVEAAMDTENALAPSADHRSVNPLADTTHRYCDHQATTHCANNCGAVMSPSRSHGPDVFGKCPKRETPPVTPCRVCKRMPQEGGRQSRVAL